MTYIFIIIFLAPHEDAGRMMLDLNQRFETKEECEYHAQAWEKMLNFTLDEKQFEVGCTESAT